MVKVDFGSSGCFIRSARRHFRRLNPIFEWFRRKTAYY